MTTSITLTAPDDWHCHFRDDEFLATTVPATARYFQRAIAMPNLVPPVTTVQQASLYQQRLLSHVGKHQTFEPLMTLYLTDQTSPDDIKAASDSKHVYACKLYPAGATTNSASGVTDIANIYPALEAMQQQQLPLLIHGEVTSAEIDIFDREARFIDDVLVPLNKRFPQLPMVLEHITTKQAADFVKSAADNIAATITVHHLLYDRNDLLVGGIKPHFYCLPILKRNIHRQALINAATSGNKKYFLGTDSAPHTQSRKESSCGCAGLFSAPAAMELYAHVFEQANALDKLEGFASFHGADFYGLARNTKQITLSKDPWQMPHSLHYGDDIVIPIAAGETINWKYTDQ